MDEQKAKGHRQVQPHICTITRHSTHPQTNMLTMTNNDQDCHTCTQSVGEQKAKGCGESQTHLCTITGHKEHVPKQTTQKACSCWYGVTSTGRGNVSCRRGLQVGHSWSQ